VHTFTIGHGSIVVTFGARDAHGFLVEVAADGLVVAQGVSMADEVFFEMLAGYFEDLAASWHGWEGEKRWRSPESDLEILATFGLRGHCAFAITVRDGPEYTWKSTVIDLVVEAGEELSQLARDVRRWANA